MIPPETDIARIMRETGMDRLQAIRHLQARETLSRRILRPVYGDKVK